MTYVMSDIHGRLDRFEEVLKLIQLKDSDRLYVLGDVVDRNSGGVALLMRLMEMPNATLLMGNHELMMRQCLFEDADSELWMSNGGGVTLYEYIKLSNADMLKIWKYLQALPYEAEVTVNQAAYVLAHAKPLSLCQSEEQAKAEYAAVWTRLKADETPYADKTLVFGHTPTIHYQQGMPLKPWYGKGLIDIDCGCSSSDGRLLCLRLDDMKEFYSTI